MGHTSLFRVRILPETKVSSAWGLIVTKLLVAYEMSPVLTIRLNEDSPSSTYNKASMVDIVLNKSLRQTKNPPHYPAIVGHITDKTIRPTSPFPWLCVLFHPGVQVYRFVAVSMANRI